MLAERLAGFRPRVLLTLGSGLGGLAEEVADALVIPAGEVGLPSSTVPGHAGRLVAGTLNEVPVLVQQGRVHLYEGVPAADVTATVRAAAEAGADTFLVTNAAGGIDLTFAPGDVMLITDQLNLAGTSPLRGPHFVDMTDAYDPGLRATAMDLAGDLLVTGVYAGLRGPAFETPAEVSMLRTLGASAVGMSTVLEVIAARALGLRIAGFSLITNVHRPGGTHTDHQEVLAAAANAGPRLATVVHDLLPHL